jgi:3-oxoacyl-[acyl-carrier protein] reductase
MTGSRSLEGRIAFVTGGSNGIGAATVRLLAEGGATVVIGYNRGADRAAALLAEIGGGGHATQQLTLEDSTSIAAAAKAIGDRFGRLDILVNSAGYTRPVPHADLDALDDALFDTVLIANVRGPFATIRAMVPLLRASADAVIVNVSSLAAITGVGSSIAYGASKAALDTMSMSLARVLGPTIRVLCVSPGAVATDFVAGRDRAALEKMAQATPLKRVVEADDIALSILACVTHLRVATGTRIVVDGGRHL